jgi:hypothetical protein
VDIALVANFITKLTPEEISNFPIATTRSKKGKKRAPNQMDYYIIGKYPFETSMGISFIFLLVPRLVDGSPRITKPMAITEEALHARFVPLSHIHTQDDRKIPINDYTLFNVNANG